MISMFPPFMGKGTTLLLAAVAYKALILGQTVCSQDLLTACNFSHILHSRSLSAINLKLRLWNRHSHVWRNRGSSLHIEDGWSVSAFLRRNAVGDTCCL